MAAVGPLLLLRHAAAGERRAWDGADRDRPLDARGRSQADALPDRLMPLGFADAILVSSPHVRCVATLEPFAARLEEPVIVDERLAEVDVPLRSSDGWPDAAWLGARGLQAIEAARSIAGDRPIVLCSHGDLLPAVLAALVGRSGADVPAHLDLTRKSLAKGAGWLVVSAGDRLLIRQVPAP